MDLGQTNTIHFKLVALFGSYLALAKSDFPDEICAKGHVKRLGGGLALRIEEHFTQTTAG